MSSAASGTIRSTVIMAEEVDQHPEGQADGDGNGDSAPVNKGRSQSEKPARKR